MNRYFVIYSTKIDIDKIGFWINLVNRLKCEIRNQVVKTIIEWTWVRCKRTMCSFTFGSYNSVFFRFRRLNNACSEYLKTNSTAGYKFRQSTLTRELVIYFCSARTVILLDWKRRHTHVWCLFMCVSKSQRCLWLRCVKLDTCDVFSVLKCPV